MAATRFEYDGQALIGEYDSSTVLQKRYVHGPGADEPLVEYDKSGGGYTRAWLHPDERGSVIARSNDGGATTAVSTYDEYGVPGSGNTGRFGYTGQAWLPSLGAWYYKARMYAPSLGRFMQTDPIGYGDGINWYNYVGSDPVNASDPSGRYCDRVTSTTYAYQNADGSYGPILSQSSSLEGDTCNSLFGTDNGIGIGIPDIIVNGTRPAKPGTAPGINSPIMPQRDARCSRVVPLPKMMTDATNSALSAINQNPGGNSARDLNSGFSSLGALPNFSGGGWVSRPSSHSSQAYEHSLPGSSGMSVKVYINDSENSGLNTITITPPTYSVLHFAEYPFFRYHLPINTYNAATYLGDLHGC